jgi:putative addiction module component (TIGR02574 family)
MESLEQIARKSINLEPVERLKLVEAILFSLDKIDPEIEKSWIAESEARIEAYKKGEIQAINWDDIKSKYQKCA